MSVRPKRFAFGVVILLGAMSATARGGQQAGWTVPPTANQEKSPLKQTPDIVKKGRAVFTSKCQRCHGPQAKGDGPDSNPQTPAADLTDEFRFELNPEGVLYHKIWNGRPPQMPAFKSQMTRDETWQVVEYLKSLRPPQ